MGFGSSQSLELYYQWVKTECLIIEENSFAH